MGKHLHVLLLRIASKDINGNLQQALNEKVVGLTFTLKVYQSVAAVRKDYPEKLPEDKIIVMGESLRDGSAKAIFDLFTEKSRQNTIICTWDSEFKEIARQEGFVNIKDNLTSGNGPSLADYIVRIALKEKIEEEENEDSG